MYFDLNSPRPSARSLTLATTTPSIAAGWGKGGGKAVQRKRAQGCWSTLPGDHGWTWASMCPGGQGQWDHGLDQEYCGQLNLGRDHSPVLSEATPRVPCSVLGPSLQEHWGAGACPKKGNGAAEGPGAQVLWRVAEGARVRKGKERKLRKDLIALYKTWKEGVAKWGSVSSPNQLAEEWVSCCARGG